MVRAQAPGRNGPVQPTYGVGPNPQRPTTSACVVASLHVASSREAALRSRSAQGWQRSPEKGDLRAGGSIGRRALRINLPAPVRIADSAPRRLGPTDLKGYLPDQCRGSPGVALRHTADQVGSSETPAASPVLTVLWGPMLGCSRAVRAGVLLALALILSGCATPGVPPGWSSALPHMPHMHRAAEWLDRAAAVKDASAAHIDRAAAHVARFATRHCCGAAASLEGAAGQLVDVGDGERRGAAYLRETADRLRSARPPPLRADSAPA